jgi:hypothetical protein
MAAAAAVGVVVAQPSGSRPPAPPADTAAAVRARASLAAAAETRAAIRAATVGDQQLTTLVRALAVARNRSLTRVLNARTAHAQAAAAAAVGATYAAAARRAAPLAATTDAAGPLTRTLRATAADYARLAAAGRTNSQRRWNDIHATIRSDEHELQHEISKL